MRLLLITLLFLNSLMLFGQTETSCNQTLSGEIRDQFTKELLPGAELVLTDKDGNIVASQVVAEEAKFSFKINCETQYKLEGKKEKYTTESKDFTTTNVNGLELKLIVLLGTGEIDFVSDGVTKKKVAVKDSVASVLPDTIKKVAKVKKDSITKEIQPKIIPEEQKLPIDKPKVIKNVLTIKIDPVYFDYESSYLNTKAIRELQKVISLMQQYPKMHIECVGHTDAKGEAAYNMWMSKRRGKRVADYMISEGIDVNRISSKGYGETQLLNQCTDDVECTDKQRAINRRTEFVIVKM